MKKNRLGNWLPRAGVVTTTTMMLGLAMAACLTRPVGTQPPTTKVNFTSTQYQQAVDKVDILFAIDNSASMGDKQQILADAVPTLLNGLLNPRCVDPDTNQPDPSGKRADPVQTKANRYGCTAPYDAEFVPVTDLHIGIVSSSLGSLLGGGLNGADPANPRGGTTDLCLDGSGGFQNDLAHLINRKPDGNAAAEASPPANFLAWFPESEANRDPNRHPRPQNAIADNATLNSVFSQIVLGTGQDGCGFEAQLESMYRFLIQPDPYTRVQLAPDGRTADLGDGIDWDLLKQRAEFLRPDSLVAVIMLTDEDDSSEDPLSLGGQGFNFVSSKFAGSGTARTSPPTFGTTAPLPTKVCETNPGDPNCTSCGFYERCKSTGAQTPVCLAVINDPNCTSGNGFYPADQDPLTVRFYHMKQRFGIDPQYPISRYVSGFTSGRVPDRKTEHTVVVNGTNRSVSDYVGSPKCTNPLYASALPTAPPADVTKLEDAYCNLPRGTRDPSTVFFAIVGGVPNQLLYGETSDGSPDYRPGDAEHNTPDDARWTKILGKDSTRFDYTGIDPHMIQDVNARPALATGGSPTSPRGTNGTDRINGRDWNTNGADLQYACTFDIATRNCDSTAPAATQNSCDCIDPSGGRTPASAQNLSNQPLCSPTSPFSQVKAKAYPTIRQLQLARALGPQGIAASLCPINPQLTLDPSADKNDPTYGYNPAVASIIDRLKNALTQQCLPQSLRDEPDGGYTDNNQLEVPCLILAQLGENEQRGCGAIGLKDPDAAVLKVFQEQQREEAGGVAGGLADRKVCEVEQVIAQPGQSCKSDPTMKWCYVENKGGAKPAGRCSQAIVFSAGTQDLAGARFSLQCIRQFSAGAAAGDNPNTAH